MCKGVKRLIEENKKKYKDLDKDNLKIQKAKDKLIINEIKEKIKEKIKSKEYKEEVMKECKNAFCNPKCTGTIFQNNKFPTELVDKYKKEKDGELKLKTLRKLRKIIFANKKSILKDNFYEKLKNIDSLKKKGALSGCALFSLV